MTAAVNIVTRQSIDKSSTTGADSTESSETISRTAAGATSTAAHVPIAESIALSTRS